jgi:hypothetical protein
MDLVGPPQLAVLPLPLGDAPAVLARRAGPPSPVDLRLVHPLAQGLGPMPSWTAIRVTMPWPLLALGRTAPAPSGQHVPQLGWIPPLALAQSPGFLLLAMRGGRPPPVPCLMPWVNPLTS